MSGDHDDCTAETDSCCESNPVRTHSAADANRQEGCPTPLAWRHVLDAFRSESSPWWVDRGTYRIEGRSWGEGPPLYFLNGMGGTHELFALLVWLLKDSHRCIVYDYPGTEIPVSRLSRISLADLGADLFAIADRFGDRDFDICATSFGSLVALSAMESQPDRIHRAVIQGGFAHRSLSMMERRLIGLCRAFPGTLRQVPGREFIAQQNHRPWFPPFDRSRWQFFLEDTGKVRVRSICHRAALIRDADLRPLLARIECPVLLIHSEGDGLVSRQCHEVLKQNLSGAKSEWMANTGHIPQLTHPHRFAKLVTSFLSETAALIRAE